MWYFDPGNSSYFAVIRFACPEFIRDSGLNVEHVGDMIEAILGLYFHLAEEGHVQNLNRLYPVSRVSLTQAVRFWRIMVYHQFVISSHEHWHSY